MRAGRFIQPNEPNQQIYGFFIGDSALCYKPETIVESFHDLSLCKSAWLTLDWQRIFNPAYNADRGPVSVGTLRFHTEF